MKERKKKVGSVGKKVGIIISILLLVILGGKTLYDSVTSYRLAISNHENYEKKKLKALARGEDLKRLMKQVLHLWQSLRQNLLLTVEPE